MKYFLIQWKDGIHQGSAIVQACDNNQAIVKFMENTKGAINNSSKITSIEECPVSEVPTLITELWI